MKKQLLGLAVAAAIAAAVPAAADTYDRIESAQEQKYAAENALANTRDRIYTLNEEREELQSYLSDLESEITSLSSELEEISNDIVQKVTDIKKAKAAVKRAKINERKQYDGMVSRIQYMYENGSADLVVSLLASEDITQFLNKAAEAQEMTKYDRDKLNEYKETKEIVIQQQLDLEEDQNELNKLKQESEDKLAKVGELANATEAEISEYTEKIGEAEYKASGLAEEVAYQRSLLVELERQAAEEEAERERQAAREAEEARWAEEHADDSDDEDYDSEEEEDYDSDDEEDNDSEDEEDYDSEDGEDYNSEDEEDYDSEDEEDYDSEEEEDYDSEDEEDYDSEDEEDYDSEDEEDYDSEDEEDYDSEDEEDYDSEDEEDYDSEDDEDYDSDDEEDYDSEDDEEDYDSEDEDESEDDSSSQGEYLGNFTLTAYCWCAKCNGSAGQPTASGVNPTSGHTVAMGGVDFGTKLLINGTVYTVEDRGTPYGHVDIFMDSHEEALQFGLQYADVYLVE